MSAWGRIPRCYDTAVLGALSSQGYLGVASDNAGARCFGVCFGRLVLHFEQSNARHDEDAADAKGQQAEGAVVMVATSYRGVLHGSGRHFGGSGWF